ncbi:hypothetical protein DPMN_058750 [Dreissena polymorpha]|uniref:Reverse transcriptase domain-containing protein n=1 Tax=Dreissena polymorpha TaxID=45954 RepID=A0A9D4C2M5_DREPO|nr:hypothetical protein DPMN_058750 [Dreissena polymorpha]
MICIEYLSHYIQSNKHIKGISLEPDEEIKQSLFADDATYFLNDSSDSFNNLIESLTLFGMASGLKLNKTKCTVLRTGRCPLSSSLFMICIEYLSHYIQSNKHIKGISLEPDEEIKQSLFADDATYFLNDSSDSFNNLIESLTLFGMASGLKLNKTKCTVLRYLSHYIQSNKHIKGISLEPDEEIKQSLFADDATYFLNDSSDSFNNLIESLTLFGMASGLKLNKTKCTVLRIQTKANSPGTQTQNQQYSYLSHYIQSNKHIKGISLEPDEEIKQSLFADDATYFLNDSSDSFNNLIESLTLFGMASGLKLNKTKCTVLRTN